MRYSDNYGTTWSEELYVVDIGIAGDDYVGSVGNIIINSSNQDILFAQMNTDNFHSLVLYKSTEVENGLNWSSVGTTIVAHTTWQFYEPCLAYVDERLFCGIRCDSPGDGQVFGFVYSDDHGITWSDLHVIEEMGGTQWTYIPVPWGLALAARGPSYDARDSGNARDPTMLFTSPDGMSWSSEFQYLTLPTKGGPGGYCSSVTLSNGDIMLFQANGSSLLGYTLSF